MFRRSGTVITDESQTVADQVLTETDVIVLDTPSGSQAIGGTEAAAENRNESELGGNHDRDKPGKQQPGRKRFLKNCLFWLVVLGLAASVWLTGLTVSVVKTGSMRPGIQPGDLVVSVSSKIVHPGVGSIIVAKPKVTGQELPAIAHRVIEINPDGTYKTKGDYNPEPDAWRDRPEDISSVVLFKVPMGWTRSPVTIAVGFGILAMVFLWPSAKKPEDESEGTADAGALDLRDEPLIDLADKEVSEQSGEQIAVSAANSVAK